jgi:hypothetical protein
MLLMIVAGWQGLLHAKWHQWKGNSREEHTRATRQETSLENPERRGRASGDLCCNHVVKLNEHALERLCCHDGRATYTSTSKASTVRCHHHGAIVSRRRHCDSAMTTTPSQTCLEGSQDHGPSHRQSIMISTSDITPSLSSARRPPRTDETLISTQAALSAILALPTRPGLCHAAWRPAHAESDRSPIRRWVLDGGIMYHTHAYPIPQLHVRGPGSSPRHV